MMNPLISPEQKLLNSLTNSLRIDQLHLCRLLNSASEPTFDFYTKMASKLLGAPISLISLVDSNREFFKSSSGLPQQYRDAQEVPLTHSFCQHVVHQERPVVIMDSKKDPLVQQNLGVRDLSINAYLGVPIEVNGQTLGSFCVIDTEPRQWRSEDLEVMNELVLAISDEIRQRIRVSELEEANRDLERVNQELQTLFNRSLQDSARTTIELKRMLHSLASLVLRDPLTHCYNRQYIQQGYERAMEAVSVGHSCAIMALDLDKFKEVNDTAGHAAGDRLLKKITKLIKSCLREGDELVRLGGDEFLIFLNNIAPAEAVEIAENIRRKVDEFNFHESKHDFKLSASIGLTCFAESIPLDELLSAADRACYQAKNAGKNRVVSSTLHRPISG